ncbi:MAG: winged helix-turn-helix domain-containing protein [Myxococcota bacterium]
MSRRLRLSDRVVDLDAQTVELVDRTVRLTPRETQLLALLADRPGAVLDRSRIVADLWGHASGSALYTTVERVRKKIEADPSRPRHLLTVHGDGLKLVVTLDADPMHRVPVHATPLVGRVPELDAVRAAWAGGARVVTVRGPPGVGKTRLAHAVASASAPGTAAVWVDVTEARELARVLHCVGAALRVPVGDQAIDRLGRAIDAAGAELWVIDNAEQAAAAVSRCLEAWVALAPSVRWLVTSREALGLPGEAVVPLGPLSVEEAVALLTARANHPLDGAAGVRVVNRLDRLPLAIELAAPLLRSLGPHTVEAALDRQLELLRTDRGRPARHLSLRAAIAWSWELLSDAERSTMQCLWVFPGRFGLADAEAACGEAPGSPLEVLHRLVSASMIECEPGAGRFWLLEAIRAFARAGTPPSVARAVRERHAHRTVERAESLAEAAWTDPRASDELVELVSSLFCALELAEDAVDGALALRVALAMRPVGGRAGRRVDAHLEVLDRAIALPGGEPADRGIAIAHRAWFRAGEPRAFPELELAESLVRETTPMARLEVDLIRGEMLFMTGRVPEAVQSLERTVAVVRADPGAAPAPRALVSLARAYLWQGDPQRAMALAHEALALARRLGVGRIEWSALRLLSRCASAVGDPERGAAWADEAGRLARRAGDLTAEAEAFEAAGLALGWVRPDAVAYDAFDRALRTFRAVGFVNGELASLCNRGEVALCMGRWAEARDDLERAVHLARAVGDPRSEVDACEGLAACLAACGRTEEAIDLLQRGLELARATGHRVSEGVIRARLSDAYLTREELDRAASVLATATEILRPAGMGALLSGALRTGAWIARAQGHPAAIDAAREAWETAVGARFTGGEVRGRALHGTLLALAGRRDEARATLDAAERALVGQTDPTGAALVEVAWCHLEPERAPAVLASTHGDLVLRDGVRTWSTEVRRARDHLTRGSG